VIKERWKHRETTYTWQEDRMGNCFYYI